jgi:hypothetical protein
VPSSSPYLRATRPPGRVSCGSSAKRIDGWREHRCSKEGKSVGGRATTITALTEREGRPREGGLRVSCACQFWEASSRHAARCGCAGRPVRLRQSAPPLCRASASAGAAFRCPGAAVGLTERCACGSDLLG